MKKILFLFILLLSLGDCYANSIELPQSIDKRHWIYFGWEESHPKAISLMGGALYARRPCLGGRDNASWKFSREAWHEKSSSPVFFMLGVDGSSAYYPDENATDRRTSIKWSLAEGYLPFPVSQWQHDGIQVEIKHFGRRILDNIVEVVYSQVKLKNVDKSSHKTSLFVRGEAVAERVFSLNKAKMDGKEADQLEFVTELAPGKETVYEFAIPANGTSAAKSIVAMGGFEKNYKIEKDRILSKMNSMTLPVSLPDPQFVDLWKSSMTYMWNTTVKAAADYEQRGSGGNIKGWAQYDQAFNHDVPDMVIQYIIEGNIDVAKKIMAGAQYEYLSKGELKKWLYLDAIPKYIMTMAQYLQMTGDRDYFTDELFFKLKRCARAINRMRQAQFQKEYKEAGLYGLIQKGSTLDNAARSYLIVDNFAALHGYAAYEYICKQFNLTEEKQWVENEIKDLNTCLNNAIEKSVRESGQNWYNACFSFNIDPRILSGPGNWLGTTFQMSTFPWNAYLKGFNLRGAWADHLDASVDRWMQKAKDSGCPEGSGGAWWGAQYGSTYNVGMAMPLLYSENKRTMVHQFIDWMIKNQSSPYQWGESFRKPRSENDWTEPATDYEVWGLGFIRQGMLQMCVSLHVDGTVILGRGIPDEWVNSGKEISWKNVFLNNGKKLDFLSFQKTGNRIDVLLKGDKNEGNYVLNLPALKSNIDRVEVKGGEVVSTDNEAGKVTVTGNTSMISVYVK